MNMRWSALRLAAVLVAVGLATGCATTAMKGTPFFSGDYEKSMGPAENRVNVWPLLYYRDPALSALWPFVEYVDGEHFALRPLYSVYGLGNKDGSEHNVLWPIFQQDNASETGRLVPFFWGPRYVVGFPLYWHFRRGEAFSDTFFPLWFYNRDSGKYSLSLILGLAGASHDPYGDSNRLLPLWYWSSAAGGSTFLSLPWCSVTTAKGDGWKMAFPFFYTKDKGERHSFVTLAGGRITWPTGSGWVVPLLLSGGSRDLTGHDTWLLAGLAHWGAHGSNTSSHVFPLYYKARDADGDRFLSLPWSNVHRDDGSNWQLVPPLFFRSEDHEGSLALSPFYCSAMDTVGSNSWQLVPPLYFHSEGPSGERTLSPVFSAGRSKEDGGAWHTVFPLYYSSTNREGSLFATLLGGIDKAKDGQTWMVYPLLTWNRSRGGTNDFWALAPLVHFRNEPTNSISHVAPLYYRNAAAGTFVSLPYSTWASGQTTQSVIPPLLAWKRSQGERSDLWLLAGLGRYSWGAAAGASYLVPLFYGSPASGEFLSPLYCRFEDSEGTTAVIPPLLGAFTKTRTGTRDLWALAGLYHHEWDTEGTRSDYLLPFYLWSPSNYFCTLLAGWSGTERDAFRYYLTPLIGSSTRNDAHSFWFFPFYGRTVHTNTGQVRGHVLWGGFNHGRKTSHSSFFPLYGYDNYGPKDDPPSGDARGTLRGSDFLCFPWCWRTDTRRWNADKVQTPPGTMGYQDEYSHGAFPLWSHTEKNDHAGHTEEQTRLLFLLYSSRHESTPLATAPGGTNEYVRRSVLWRAWHYERLNGDVTADVFPFITYDARKDGFRKHSFLWRLYRWERDAEGRRKLDLLFIPILRDRPAPGTSSGS